MKLILPQLILAAFKWSHGVSPKRLVAASISESLRCTQRLVAASISSSGICLHQGSPRRCGHWVRS